MQKPSEEFPEMQRLRDMTPEELAADREASRIVNRLLRRDVEEDEPVRVAAFSSAI